MNDGFGAVRSSLSLFFHGDLAVVLFAFCVVVVIRWFVLTWRRLDLSRSFCMSVIHMHTPIELLSEKGGEWRWRGHAGTGGAMRITHTRSHRSWNGFSLMPRTWRRDAEGWE